MPVRSVCAGSKDPGEGRIGGCTDITGFGLAGHLLEMISGWPGDKGAKVMASELPIFPGVTELFEKGVFSSLHRKNVDSFADGVHFESGSATAATDRDGACFTDDEVMN